MTSKLSYKQIVASNLFRHHAEPGDEISLTIRNAESDESMYQQAQRSWNMFLHGFGFFPQEVAMHSDHLSLLKKQGKSLDILVNEDAAKLIGQIVDMVDIPRRIPLVADDTLDLFTTVARFTFRKEDKKEMAVDAILGYFKSIGGGIL